MPTWHGSRYCSVECHLLFHANRVPNGCLEWTGSLLPAGYGGIRIAHKTRRAHVVAWQLSHGTIPSGLWVLHSCDNRKCIEVTHLFLGTHLDNMRDCSNKNRTVRGRPRSNRVKLMPSDVKQIKRLLAQKITSTEISRCFGVHRTTIVDIKAGRNWAWL